MKNSLLSFTLTATIALSAIHSQAAERVGDFALLDQAGYFHHMSWYDNNKAIVLLTQANGEESLVPLLDHFQAMADEYADADLVFFLINPMGKKNRDAVQAEMERLDISVPVLMDDAQLVSEALGVTHIGQALIYNPSDFSLIYSGPLDDDFANAVAAISAGDSATATHTPITSGTAVTYTAKLAHAANTPSYADDIAPIIEENCAKCHREGGVAPFALDSHTMLLGWSPMIREVIMTKRMPPGQVDPHIGDFENDMVLADNEAQQLLHWIEAGSPQDGTRDPLAAIEWPESEWAFGEPDYIIEVPPQEIPATGVLDYYNVVVDVDIEKDRWVRASIFRVTEPCCTTPCTASFRRVQPAADPCWVATLIDLVSHPIFPARTRVSSHPTLADYCTQDLALPCKCTTQPMAKKLLMPVALVSGSTLRDSYPKSV